jgi:hypothetical protein
MQYILQEYTLHTCHESAQSGPFVMCFHLAPKLVTIQGDLTIEWRCFDELENAITNMHVMAMKIERQAYYFM